MKLRLNLGEPAYPLPEFVQKELCEYLGEVHRFPHNYEQLEKEIAKEFGVKEEKVALTNGAHGGIDVTARAFGKKTLIFTPTYIEYAWAPKRNNFELKKANALKGKEYRVNVNEPELKKATLAFLANPNNPFGFTPKKKIKEILENTSGVLAVDETYWWFKGESVASLVKEFDNLLIMGSFSKSLSLAGMRVGYIISPKKLLEKMQDKLLYFRVSALSAQAVLICLKHREYFKKRVQNTIAERKKFENWMQKKGFDLYITHNNNVVVKFSSEKKATAFTKHLDEKGIIVLQGNGISTVGLDDSFVRITIGTEKEMNCVREAIEGFLE